MRKKYLIIAVVAVLLLASFTMVACANNNGGKGFEEIVQMTDYNNSFVAKSKTGYNVFNEKGKKLFKDDFDEVNINKQGVIFAKNMADAEFKYFNMQGKELHLSVSGLTITSVTINENTKYEIVDGNMKTKSFDNGSILVEYLDSTKQSSFFAMYDIDGNKKASNVAMLSSVGKNSYITTIITSQYKTEKKYVSDNTYNYNEMWYYVIKEMRHGATQSCKVMIYDSSLKELYSSGDVSSEIGVSNYNTYDYIVVSVNKNSIKTDILVNILTGATKEFLNIDSQPLYTIMSYQKDVAIAIDTRAPYATATVQLYSIENNKFIEVLGIGVIDLGDYLAVKAIDENSKTGYTFSFYNKKTLVIARNDATSVQNSNGTIIIDNCVVDEKLNSYLGSGSNDIINSRVLYSNSGTDVSYYLNEKAGGSKAYYKNGQLLKEFGANEVFNGLDNSNSNYFIMRNTTDYSSTKYLIFNPSIQLVNCVIDNRSQYSVIKEMNSSGLLTKIHVVFFGAIYTFDASGEADNYSVNATVTVDNTIATITIFKNLESGKVHFENYVYFSEAKSQEKMVQLYSSKVDVIEAVEVDRSDERLIIAAKCQNGENSSNYMYNYAIFDRVSRDQGNTYQAVKACQFSSQNRITVEGDYATELSAQNGSNYHNVYSLKSGKKILTPKYAIEDIQGDLAIFTNNGITHGVMRLSDKDYKILDDAKYIEAEIVSDEYYMLASFDKNMVPVFTFKDVKGKTIVKNVYALDFNIMQNSSSNSVVDGKMNLNIVYQKKAGGAYTYKSLGRVVSVD